MSISRIIRADSVCDVDDVTMYGRRWGVVFPLLLFPSKRNYFQVTCLYSSGTLCLYLVISVLYVDYVHISTVACHISSIFYESFKV
jgi:hypothetical protein